MEEEEEGEESEGKEGGPALECIFCLSFCLFPWCDLFSFAALGWRRLGSPTVTGLGKGMTIL